MYTLYCGRYFLILDTFLISNKFMFFCSILYNQPSGHDNFNVTALKGKSA